MTFSSWLANLEKRGLISRTPHPAILFILSIVMGLLGFTSSKIKGAEILEIPLYFLAIFGLLFAVGHLVAWCFLSRKD